MSDAPATESVIDLADLVGRLVEQLRATTGRAIELHVRSHSPVRVRADLLSGALRHLVEHSLARGDGDIDVEVEAGTVRVGDRGPDATPTELGNLTERFYRGTMAGDDAHRLGLQLVHQFALTYEGTVGFAARPGGGMITSLELPVAFGTG